MSFVHLHTHSHYSLLDGLSKIDALVDKAHELEMPALALTDHGNLYGAIEFYQKCKKKDLKPILGVEAYVARRGLKDKVHGIDDKRYHLILLAKNNTGWQNLIKLVTISNLEGFYYKPRIDHETLKKHSEGLIGLSACMGGEIPRALLSNEKDRALELLQNYKDTFGEEDFYIEISHHPNIPNHEKLMGQLIDLAKETSTPLVATQDIHYTNREDGSAQDVLIAVQTNRRLDDEDRLTMKEDNFSFASTDEMKDFFKDTPEAIENTIKIADKCNVDITLGVTQLPHFPIPDGKTAEQYLNELSQTKLKERYENPEPVHQERLEYELGVIQKSGFTEYFLIVQDFINWAKEQKIVVGPGRGSGAGSLVAYVLGITNIDPIKYNLLFERFMNPERISPPDFDIDLADTRRDEVIDYVAQKYGRDHVAQIITFGTMAARAAVRDAARALGKPLDLADQLAKAIPFNPNQGQKEDYLNECLEKVPEFTEMYKRDPDAKEVVDAAKKLEGVVRHASTHACAVVITKDPLTEQVPLQYATGREDSKESLVTQFEMHAIEDLGLLKMDFLGLNNLSIIEETLKRIKKLHNEEIDIDAIDIEDAKTYKTLADGRTVGVFQLESQGMTRFLKELKPTNIEDVIAMISLYRPGTLDAGMIPHYIDRKHGKEEVTYLHPKLEPVLKNTFGIMIYQEQLMQAAQALAGFTLPQADTLRKAVGKKIRKLLNEQKDKLVAGIIKETGSDRVANEFWVLVEPFARYGFNRSHAAAYATIAYQTAWLKTHYPTEFFCSLLNSAEKNIDRLAFLLSVAVNEGITILPPDVNESRAGFAVTEDKTIRFGLASIKNVGHNVVSAIVEERDNGGKYDAISDFVERIWSKDLNRRSLDSLIKSGAMDIFGERNKLLFNLQTIIDHSKQSHAQGQDQGSLFGLLDDKSSIPDLKLEETKPASQTERLGWEKELLGLYVSGHPLDGVGDVSVKTIPVSKLKDGRSRRNIKVLCMLGGLKRIITKKGEPMVFLKIQDKTDEIEGVAFPSVYKMQGHMLEEDKFYIVTGKVNERNGIPSFICDNFEVVETT